MYEQQHAIVHNLLIDLTAHSKKNYFVYIMNYVHNMEFGLHCLGVFGCFVCLFVRLFVHSVGVYCFASFK